MSERLTMLVIVGTRKDEHSLRSQVGIGSESDCLLASDSEAEVKTEKLGEWQEERVSADMMWQGAWLVRERRSLDILPVKKEAKVSASEVPGKVVGSGEGDLRCRSLLTVCQRRLGLSEAQDTRLE